MSDTKKMYGVCRQAGELLIKSTPHPMNGNFVDADRTKGLEHYTWATPEQLFETAKSYDKVNIAGDWVKGADLSIGMATKAFE